MKIRSLLLALSTIALATPVLAQEAPAPDAGNLPAEPMKQQLLEPAVTGKYGPRLLEEQGYVWYSRHFVRLGPDSQGNNSDSNRVNLYMPWDLPFTEIRGYGQIFAPGMFYSLFGSLTSDTTGLIFNDAYYEQFKDARDFTIDTIRTSWFKNPNAGTPLAGATFYVYRSPAGVTDKTYFNATGTNAYRSQGARFDRDELPIAFEAPIDPEGIDTTLNGDFINPIVMVFDPPLTFAAGTFAIPMIINDEGEALSNITPQTDIRDFQVMASYFEFRQGQRQGFGSSGTASNIWKSLGLTLWRPRGEPTPDRDTIFSMWRRLSFGQAPNAVPAAISHRMEILGTVDISAGVKYHFGREATSQGLGSPTPNPVVATSRLPFSLTEVAQVTIDLFDAAGNHVRTLAESRYVPGNYTVALPIDELTNGTYVARMVAGQNVYSMKVNVAK